MTAEVIVSNEFLTIDAMGVEVRMVNFDSIKTYDTHNDLFQLSLKQVDGTLMYWTGSCSRERDRLYRNLMSELKNYVPNQIDLIVDLGGHQVESRMIRSYRAYVGDDYPYPRIHFWLHGRSSEKQVFFNSNKEGMTYYVRFLSQIHSISERQARFIANSHTG